jgi:hypothetical protein
MHVFLTFDVEIWCEGWQHLDERFPAAFRRYIYGSSSRGNFALPHILETLSRHGLHGVFFVEPMFAGRFGMEHLAVIVEILKDAGQEVQLHLHPEWTDEIQPCPLASHQSKRQHLHHYSRDEQTKLIAYGVTALQQVGIANVTSFRAGSFAGNTDTFHALRANGLRQDSSVDATVAISFPDSRHAIPLYCASIIDGVEEYPMGVFVDGFGRERHAQLGACSAAELIAAMECAHAAGWTEFVILSHNFELLKVGSSMPDWIVLSRFKHLCRYLAQHAKELPTCGFSSAAPLGVRTRHLPLPRVSLATTLRRHSEQVLRRLH